MERHETIKKLAFEHGLTEAFLRAACRRGAGHHPLPHMECGGKRPIFKVRPSVLDAWIEEEERIPSAERAGC